jgi:hypothetical protein
MRTIITKRTGVHDTKRRISGHAYYYSLRKMLSHLLSEMLKMRTYKTIILTVLLYRYEKWSLTQRKECKSPCLRTKWS